MVIAAMVNRQKEIVDRNEVLFEIYKEAYETDDWTEYTTQKVQIDGLTHVLPDPYWSVGDNATYSYSWDDANGNNRYLSNREDITEPPTGCFVTYTGISLEDAQLGLSILSSETFIPGTESAYLASFEYEGSEIFLRWKDNELDMMVEGEQICFVPFWYE